MMAKITNYFILAFLFLLPWQTRWIYSEATLNGRPWEYGTLSFYGTEILLWLIVILTGIRFIARSDFWKKAFAPERFKKRWPYLVIGVALAFAGGYSVALSPVQDITLQFLSRYIGILCMTLCLGLAELPFRRTAFALWGGGLIQGLLAFWQFINQQVTQSKWLGMASQLPGGAGVSVVQTESERWLRAYGSFGSPNSLGIFLAVVLLIGLLLTVESKDSFGKWRLPFFFGGQAAIFIGLILSFSRAAWIAAVTGIIAYFVIAKIIKLPEESRVSAFRQTAVFVLLAAIIVALYFPLFGARLTQDTYLEKLSVSERLSQYKIAGQIFLSAPLAGVGPGLYTNYLAEHYKAPGYGNYEPVHNIYLLSLAEAGLPVFVLLGVFVFWLVNIIVKNRPLFLAVAVPLLAAGLFDHFLWSMYAGQAIFWIIFGLGLAKKETLALK